MTPRAFFISRHVMHQPVSAEASDPQQLEILKHELDQTQIYHWSEVEAFARIFYKGVLNSTLPMKDTTGCSRSWSGLRNSARYLHECVLSKCFSSQESMGASVAWVRHGKRQNPYRCPIDPRDVCVYCPGATQFPGSA